MGLFSKVKKAVKKVFKKVKSVVKKVGEFVKKYWKPIVLVAAAVFTAGAALGYVGVGAGGGLAFGSAVTAPVTGWAGVTSAYGALGNTIMGAVGLGTPFSAQVSAPGVMGLGTGGMTTASGITAEGLAAINAAGGATFSGGGLLTPGTLSANIAGATPAAAAGNAAALTANNIVPVATASTPSNVAAAAGAGGAAKAGAAGLTTGEAIQLGGVGLQAMAAYKAADAQEEDQKDEGSWDYLDSFAKTPSVAPMQSVRYAQSGLMQPAPARPVVVMMDDVVGKRYGIA